MADTGIHSNHKKKKRQAAQPFTTLGTELRSVLATFEADGKISCNKQ